LATHGRRASHYRFHACDFRRNDAHLGRAEHRIAAAGDVAADGADGNVLVAKDDAGPDLDFKGQQCRKLGAGEAADVLLTVVSVSNGLR